MLRYVTLRLLQGIVVVFLVSLATFIIMQLAPGSPVDIMIGEANVTDAQIEAIERKWGFDQPVHIQYLTWLGNVVRLDFGQSVIRTGVPVGEMLAEAAPMTIRLNLLALAIAAAIAIPLGVMAAVRRYSVLDYASMLTATLGVSLPNYWVGLMLIILFSLVLGWLPPFGAEGWQSYVMPVAVLAFGEMAVLARMARGATAEVLNQDFVTTARAKGLRQQAVVRRHVVRNSLLPVVTLLGYRLAFVLSGTIVVESIFAWPGIGRLFIDSVYRLDYQVVQAIVLLLSTIVVLGNIVTDLAYAFIDPRIRVN